MSKHFILTLISALSLAAPAVAAEGDIQAGEKIFTKCKACHSIIGPDGTAIQKGGRTGPNLYGVIGRRVASEPGFNYGPSIKAVGETGMKWSEDQVAIYDADPVAWLNSKLGVSTATTKMSFKLPEGGADVAAYLASVVK